MTEKEIAERLRDMSNRIGSLTQVSLTELADELDPPRPEPGKFMFVRPKGTDERFRPALMKRGGTFVDQYSGGSLALSDFEWRPARILAKDEVAVKVPPVSEWPQWANVIVVGADYRENGVQEWSRSRTYISRCEAERMEAER